MTQLIPSMDLLDGRCVRLRQGSFDDVTRSDADVWARIRRYQTSGARELHIVDLEGARDGKSSQTALVAELIAESPLEVQIGGGIRSLERAREYLDAGAARVVVGSLAVTNPDEVERMISELGADRVTISVDFRKVGDALRPAIEGWTKSSDANVLDVLAAFAGYAGLRFLCTDISRDGMLGGIDPDPYLRIAGITGARRLIASGGYRDREDFERCAAMGLHGVVLGTALFDRLDATEGRTRC